MALWLYYTLYSNGVYEDLHVFWGFDVRLDEVIVCKKKKHKKWWGECFWWLRHIWFEFTQISLRFWSSLSTAPSIPRRVTEGSSYGKQRQRLTAESGWKKGGIVMHGWRKKEKTKKSEVKAVERVRERVGVEWNERGSERARQRSADWRNWWRERVREEYSERERVRETE